MEGTHNKPRLHYCGKNREEPANRPTGEMVGRSSSHREVEQVTAKTQDMCLDIRPLGKRAQRDISPSSDSSDREQDSCLASKRVQHSTSTSVGVVNTEESKPAIAGYLLTEDPPASLSTSMSIAQALKLGDTSSGKDKLVLKNMAEQSGESREAILSEDRHQERGDSCFWKVFDDDLLSLTEIKKQKWIFHKFAYLTRLNEPLVRLSEEHEKIEYRKEIQSELYAVGSLEPDSWSPSSSSSSSLSPVKEFDNEPDFQIQVIMNGAAQPFSVNVTCDDHGKSQIGSSELSQVIEVFLDILANKDDVPMLFGAGDDISLLQAYLYWTSASYASRVHNFVLCVGNMYHIFDRKLSEADSKHPDHDERETIFKQQSLDAFNRFFLAIDEGKQDTWAGAVEHFKAVAAYVLPEHEWRPLHRLSLEDFCDRFSTFRFSKSYVRMCIRKKLECDGIEIHRYAGDDPEYLFQFPIMPDFDGRSGGVDDDRIEDHISIRIWRQDQQWRTAMVGENF